MMSLIGMRRRFARIGLVVLLASGVLVGGGFLEGPHSAAADHNQLLRAVKNANLRTKPSKNGQIIVTIPKWAIVSSEGETRNCSAGSCAWIKVSWDGYEGWSKGKYFEPSLPINGEARANVNLNLRAGPSLSAEVLTVIPAGGMMVLTGQQHYPWVSVNYNGKKGWVHGEYLTYFYHEY